MAKTKRKSITGLISHVIKNGSINLDLSSRELSVLPEEISQFTHLRELSISNNQLTSLPEWIGQLVNLRRLELDSNKLTSLPESIGQLHNLQSLRLYNNRLTSLPKAIGQLYNLQSLILDNNQLTSLPESIGQLTRLSDLNFDDNQLTEIPKEIGLLTNLVNLKFSGNQISEIPIEIGELINLEFLAFGYYTQGNKLTTIPVEIGKLLKLRFLYLDHNKLRDLPPEIYSLKDLSRLFLYNNELTSLPESIVRLTNLETLGLDNNQLRSLPESIGQLTGLRRLELRNNQLISLPSSLSRLEHLEDLRLQGNILNPALISAYEAGLDELRSYLRSISDPAQREELYEAKLVLVGEGAVGKTTLVKALTGREPIKGEPTTHGINIDIQALHVPHPEKPNIEIQLNAWDFGGQEVYRVTHQFFFSRRSIYLVVWEPRMGVQQCQVEDWLKMIRLRVGSDARVIIVSTHCKTGQRIARIDKPIFMRDYGSMIVGFHEVDSLEDDPVTGKKVGIATLKDMIAEAAKGLEQMGMEFNRDWKEVRDELLSRREPRITYEEFATVCAGHGLDAIGTSTLAYLIHDLGYIVYFGDDEQLKSDVVLQPEWLTKAIGFVLEDQTTQEMDGILPDSRLKDVWYNHSLAQEPRYEPELYPFFLRLMERYDVLYRLEEGNASLIAQHVPQVRPHLPWLTEETPAQDRRRIGLVCVMEDAPPGLVPWMIVRTHQYAYECRGDDGRTHRLHWQKGMFLRNKSHGEAVLELREREFQVTAEAVWPEFFINLLRRTLQKLINDNWPGMKGRYYFGVPCRQSLNGRPCDGRFDIQALRQFLEEGDKTYRCQVCRTRQNIVELLYGFEQEDSREQLIRIETKLDQGFTEVQQELEGIGSRLANYVMSILQAIASESKDGPRLFMLEPEDGNWRRPFQKRYRLHLWCEAESCQHPVIEEGKGEYEVEVTREWVKSVAPYASFIAGVLKVIVPMVAPAVNIYFGSKTIDELDIKDHLEIMKEATKELAEDIEIPDELRLGALSEAERSGLLTLHALLRKLDPHHAQLGLRRIPTYTGDYLWLCEKHYEQTQTRIPEKIE
jgi:internalin A